MSLIWDKGGSAVDDAVQKFSAGQDVVLDRKLFRFDVQASKAHAHGLARIGVLTIQEADRLSDALDALLVAFNAGDFVLDDTHEDGHSAIEAHLTQVVGELGKKIHTGRSRNDQVLVASRLYVRDALSQLEGHLHRAAQVCLARAETTMFVAMPGYTHLQRAVPSSVGMWFAAFAEAFVDTRNLTRATREWLNKNPLGTAAGYGVNLPLDRDFTTESLDFRALQISPIYAQNSRGKFEIQALECVIQALLDVRRLAWDLSLFTTAEFDFVRLPDAYTTGSSIMPNKRNPDIVELLRAALAPVEAARSEVVHVLGLPSGYHRDLQNTKPPLIRGMEHGLEAMSLIPTLLERIEFSSEKLLASISGDMFATDFAVELTASGMPFRDAYRQAAQSVAQLGDRDPTESLRARTSPGGPVDPRLAALRAALES